MSQYQLDLEEQVARIKTLVAESDQRRAETERIFDERRKYQFEMDKINDERRKYQFEMDKINDERLKLQQEHQLAPWQLAFGGVTAGAALFAAIATFTKYFL